LFIIAILLLAVGVIALIAVPIVRRLDGTGIVAGIIAAVGLLLGFLFLFLSSFFTQDPGEASVLRSWSGETVGYEATPGWHWKSPWVDPVTFDIRNQRVVYTGADPNSQGDNSGGASDGLYITVQDAEGVSANIDITVRYSIDPEYVERIYADYGSEENLRARLIYNDIRSTVRSVPGRFSTIELLTNRDEVQQEIFEALERRWEDDGIVVEDVALQEIKYGETVTNAFAQAQEAQIAVETEQARLEAVQVSAQQKVVQAQAEADANAILNKSLTDAILQQRYLDTLKELAAGGNLVVVPEGFNGLVNVGR
jgi:regulator of protease activity HflC (stomatin/prohibitin superfamily)